MKKISHWLDEYFEEVILCILLAAIALILFIQIILRTFFKSSLSWAEEIARNCYVYIAFFCMPLCIKRNKMLKVDIIVDFFPERMRNILKYIGDVLCFCLWVVLFYFSFRVIRSAYLKPTYSQTLGYNEILIYGMPTFVFGLAVFREIQRLVRIAPETFGTKKHEIKEDEKEAGK